MPRTKEVFESMREATRQKIETAALPLFARKGLSVTISEIAQAAEISKGLLYNHYPSKEALIAELLRQAITISALGINDVAMTENTAAVKIEQIAVMICEMLTTDNHPGTHYFMFMIQVGLGKFPMQEAAYSAALPNPIESLAQIITTGQADGTVVDGDPIQLAILFWATVQGLCCYVMSNMAIPICSKAIANILLKGNRP